MDGWNIWNTSFLFGWPIFRCYVSFREGKHYNGWKLFTVKLQYFLVLKCVQGQGSNSPGAAGWNPRMGVFIAFFVRGGFSGKTRTPPQKKTGWNTYEWWKLKNPSCFCQFPFWGWFGKLCQRAKSGRKKHIEKNRQYQGFTGPTTRSLKHQQDCIQSFPRSVGSNFNPSTNKNKKHKSIWITFPQKKVSK